jgi:type II secretory pathway component PulK
MNGKQANRRRGTVLIVALVCLVVIMALIGGLLRGTLRARRQLHAERDKRQAELLLRAGIDRAAFRLAKEADYHGETWDLPAESIAGKNAGQVTIEATREAAGQVWKLHVVAEYPVGSDLSVRRSRTILVQSQE